MEQTVYIDLYFIINFAMDFLCFFLTARLLSIKESIFRSIIASALGALYACVSLIFGIDGILSLFVDILACIIISAVAFYRRKELKLLPVNALVYTAVSIVLGGFMTVLFSFFNRIGLDRFLGSEEDADGISVWLFALLALLSGVAAMLGGRFFKKKSSRIKCMLRLSNRGKRVEIRALCDSGNLLREPISARPCIVAELKEISTLFSAKSVHALERGRCELLGEEEMERIRVIPVRTVSGSTMMYAIRLDSVEIDFGNGWREVDTFVAISQNPINADGAAALVPAELGVGKDKI